MTNSQRAASINFTTIFGRFEITACDQEQDLFDLTLIEPSGVERKLGTYTSIIDGVTAVTSQQTGYFQWDALTQDKVPYRVHDLTCWKFHGILGTAAHDSCSEAMC
ncbi:MAG: hypothetical protein ACSHX8_04820 [Opitutaceae bacterium]